MEENKILDSFDAFTGDVLRPENVKTEEDEYIVTSINSEEQDGKHKLVLSLEKGGISKLFYLNKTNLSVITSKVTVPREMIGKKLTFTKMKVNNPKTGGVQDSLVINSIE